MSRIAALLRELADELERTEGESPPSATVPAAPRKRRRRIHTYKPKHPVTDEDRREALRRAAARGIPT